MRAAVLLGLVLAWTQGLAAEPPSEARAPVSIRAERLSVLQREGRAVFSGQVEAVQGELTIRCQELEVRYASSAAGADRAETAGREIERMLFRRDVDIRQAPREGRGERRGRCQEAVYDRVRERIDCTGDPWVEEGRNRVAGERIVYLLGRDEVQVVQPRAVLELPPPRGPKAGAP